MLRLKRFSKNSEKEGFVKIGLDEIDSKSGMRSGKVVLAAPFSLGGAVGGGIGRSVGEIAANKLDKQGKSDEEILKGSREAAGISGAAIGGGLSYGIKSLRMGDNTISKIKKKDKSIKTLINSGASKKVVDNAVKAKLGQKAVSRGLVGAGIGGILAISSATKNTKRRLKDREQTQEIYNKIKDGRTDFDFGKK